MLEMLRVLSWLLVVAAVAIAALIGVEMGNAVTRYLRASSDVDCVTWNDAKTTTRTVRTQNQAFNMDATEVVALPGPTVTTKERPTGCGDAQWLARTRARRVHIGGVTLSGQPALCVQHAADLARGEWGEECARFVRDHL